MKPLLGTAFFTAVIAFPGWALEWSSPQEISPPSPSALRHDASPRLAATPDGRLVAVWVGERTDGTTTPYQRRSDIMLSQSPAGGSSWSPAVRLDSAQELATEPDVAASADGSWSVVWNSGDILSSHGLGEARSNATGTTWTVAYSPNAQAPNHYGYFSPAVHSPQAGTWLVSAAALDAHPTSPSLEVIHARTTAGAGTFTFTTLHSAEDFKGLDTHHFRSRLASNGAGHCVAVSSAFEMRTGTGRKTNRIHVSRSSNGGQTWSTPVTISSIPVFNGPQWQNEYNPDVATDGAGTWIAVWSNTGADNFTEYMYPVFSRSVDNGATWSQPAPFTNAASDITSGVVNSTPRILSAGSNRWIAVVDDADSSQLYTTYSLDNGLTWSVPERMSAISVAPGVQPAVTPQLACLPSGRCVLVWDSKNTTSEGPGARSRILASWTTLPGSPTAAHDWMLYQ